MKSEFGIIGRNQLTFATHVHVGIPSGDVAMFVMRHMIPCLPVLLAVSANSPYWRAHETGFASYRQSILAASQSYGLPPYFEDWGAFVRFYRMAERAEVFSGFRDIHWDLRPHPDFGTLELRIMDAVSSLPVAVALTAFVRSLVVYLMEHVDGDLGDWPLARLPRWIEQTNRYQAGCRGLCARYIVDESGHVRPIRELLTRLLLLVEPVADRIGEAAALSSLQSLVREGVGYENQRRAFMACRDYRELVRQLVSALDSEDTEAALPF